MKKFIFSLVFTIVLFSCDNSKATQPPKPVENNNNFAGSYIQKGPYSLDTIVLAQVLNENFQVVRDLPQSKITDYRGKYELDISSVDPSAADKYIEVTSNGYFFNEVDGTSSQGQLELKSFGSISSPDININVNVLTHITRERIKTLINSGKSFAEATKQAKTEILSFFSVPQSQWHEFGDFNKANIFGNTKCDAFLFAVSTMFIRYTGRPASEIAELLNDFSMDFKTDGTIEDSLVLNKISEGKQKSNFRIDSYIANLEHYAYEKGLAFTQPNIKPFFTVTDTTPVLENKIVNGDFSSSVNGTPSNWIINFDTVNGADGSYSVVNRNLVINTVNPGNTTEAISIKQSPIDLDQTKRYTLILDIESDTPGTKANILISGEVAGFGRKNFFISTGNDFDITGKKIVRSFTFNFQNPVSNVELVINLGNGQTISGTKTTIKSCKIIETGLIHGALSAYTVSLQPDSDATQLNSNTTYGNLECHVVNPGTNHYSLTLGAEILSEFNNGEVYVIEFRGKTHEGNHDIKTTLTSSNKRGENWLDHISGYSTIFTLTPEYKYYATEPFTISNMQPDNHFINFQFGGDLSEPGVVYDFKDIFLYRLK